MSVDLTNLLPLLVAIPLGVGFLMPLLNKLRRERVLDVFAVIASLALFGLSLSLFRDGASTTVT